MSKASTQNTESAIGIWVVQTYAQVSIEIGAHWINLIIRAEYFIFFSYKPSLFL